VTLPRPLKEIGAGLLLRSQALRLHGSIFGNGRAIVLLYHRVNDDGDPFFPALPRAAFTAQLDYVAGHYAVEPLDEVVRWLAEGAPGRPRVVLTVDDGYPDTVEVVLPELVKRGLPATVFLSTGALAGEAPLWVDRARWLLKHARAPRLEAPWPDGQPLPLGSEAERLAALRVVLAHLKQRPGAEILHALDALAAALDAQGPSLTGLGWDGVRRLRAAGVSLGAHGHHHFPLSRLPDAELEREITASVRAVEAEAGTAVTSFAYANGEAADYDARAVRLLRGLGLRCALTTRHGLAQAGDDPFALPRLYTREPSLALFAARLAGLGAHAPTGVV
jgi:peptidoglycan/xylan/chitin deacetylase (PgdA/CDA1 family)